MHILIDLQPVQASNRNRGIGRYSLSLAIAMARFFHKKHRISLLLNANFDRLDDSILLNFKPFIEPKNFYFWKSLEPCHAADIENDWRRKASEALYSSFVEKINPDILLVMSMFEGFADSAINSTNFSTKKPIIVSVLYDLIPFIYPHTYLENQLISNWYRNCLDKLMKADLLLAISESTQKEAIDYIGLDSNSVINISSAIDEKFKILAVDNDFINQTREKYSLKYPFIMYTGGIDHRKNIESLISAYACLRSDLKSTHQLVIVCAVDENTKKRLLEHARQDGLRDGEVILTGFVSDEDLVILYNICKLFVFPSWHEGFGLPVLEAMACGAVAIAGDRSSLPEVLGFNEALFDPLDQSDMTRAIERGLTDAEFRAAVKSHSAQQIKKFSWESSAKRAVEAMEALYEKDVKTQKMTNSFLVGKKIRPRMAYVSPLKSARSGIADYSAELLPYLAKYYEIDVVVDQAEAVTDPWVLANSNQVSFSLFEQNAASYDRILYHVGNSHFHVFIFNLIEKYPGIVVLHDFFLSGVISWLELGGIQKNAWAEALWLSHGWSAIKHRFDVDQIQDVIKEWPCNLAVLERAAGVIVHSEYSRNLADRFYGRGYADDWSVIPLLRIPVVTPDRCKARQELGLNDNDVLFCSFGFIAETKLNHKILDAWLGSKLANDPNCRLVFVGESSGLYGQEIQKRASKLNGQIKITGWSDEKLYRLYLAAADIAIQLRTSSRGETSAAVLDCMNYGIATVANANGSMGEIPPDNIYMLEDNFLTEDLIFALEDLRDDNSKRCHLGLKGKNYIHSHHKPTYCAERYYEFIEESYLSLEQKDIGFTKKLVSIGSTKYPADVARLAELATKLLAENRQDGFRQILIDVSFLQQDALRADVQGPMRDIVVSLLKSPPKGFKIEPVYATSQQGYQYARQFVSKLLGLKYVDLEDQPIFVKPGDIFWGLSSQIDIIPLHVQELILFRHIGVTVVFSIFDALPLFFPESFRPEIARDYNNFIREIVSVSDGLIFPSRITLDEFKMWISGSNFKRNDLLLLGWSGLGNDIAKAEYSQSPGYFTIDEYRYLERIQSNKSFLIIGEIEKAKMQVQALAAFEILWSQGLDVSLVLHGEVRWLPDDFINKIRSHPYKDRKLFIFEEISDSFKAALYKTCSCLIEPSVADGCGLSIAKALVHELPVLARDIPFFKELAGDQINYFSGLSPYDLANEVMNWLETNKGAIVAKPLEIPFAKWEQVAQNTVDIIANDQWSDMWAQAENNKLVAHYYGSDPRLESIVGKRIGTMIWTTGERGYLTYGPYLVMRPGVYKITITGCVGQVGLSGAWLDIAVLGGTKILEKRQLIASYCQKNQVLSDINLTLTEAYSDLEIRVCVDFFSDFGISGIEIQELNANEQFEFKSLKSTENSKKDLFDKDKCKKIVMGFWATHKELLSAVGYKSERQIYTTGRAGFLIYGPYRSIAAGSYVLKVYGIVTSADDAWVDISYNKGMSVAARIPFSEEDSPIDGVIANASFKLDHFVEDIEIRLCVNSQTDMTFDCFTIEEAVDTHMVS